MKKLLFFCLCIVACTPASPTRESTDVAPQLFLLYIGSRGEGFNIYKNNPEGTGETQLTNDPGWEWYPQWNQEANMILLNTQDTSGVFEMRYIDVGGNYQEFEGKKHSSYELSSRGSWGAYTLKQEDSTQLWIFAMENPIDSLLIAREGRYNGRPKWSPDESQVLYISDRSGTNELYLFTLATKQTQRG